jgi:hypothetical protein
VLDFVGKIEKHFSKKVDPMKAAEESLIPEHVQQRYVSRVV